MGTLIVAFIKYREQIFKMLMGIKSAPSWTDVICFNHFKAITINIFIFSGTVKIWQFWPDIKVARL